MKSINKIVSYSLKKRKRSLLYILCSLVFVYTGKQLIYLHSDYSPLQVLASVENEASRLLYFMKQIQVQCNNSLATNNVSMWMLCQEPEFGIKFTDFEKDSSTSIVYSIGPTSDYNFEYYMTRNLSTHLYIFSHLAENIKFLTSINPSANSVFKTVIVPNDPADFSRNSYETQTLNSFMQNLKHKKIDVLKIDTLSDSVNSYELIKFMINDGILSNVKELHFVIKLDKLEEDYIYSWYRVLYTLFHTVGFRLYHSATSEALCLEDTMMESCKYYLSWIRDLPEHIFVMYPPAIDGSYQHEKERIENYFHVTEKENLFQHVKFKLIPTGKDNSTQHQIFLDLSKLLLSNNAQPCNILFILDTQYKDLTFHARHRNTGCTSHKVVLALPDAISQTPQFYSSPSMTKENKTSSDLINLSQIKHLLSRSATSVMYVEMLDAWDVVDSISRAGLPKYLHQLIIRTYILTPGYDSQSSMIRRRYSQLRGMEAFQLKLVNSHKEMSWYHGAQVELYTINFIKKDFIS